MIIAVHTDHFLCHIRVGFHILAVSGNPDRQLIAIDALYREESCGGHFRVEHQTEEGEAKRDDKNCFYVSCWEYQGEDKDPVKYEEPLKYEAIEVKTRNYKN